MVTIKEVAKHAGVGTTTVSRVLNNSPLVSEETKNKIMKIMNELDYQPNTLARGLAGSSSFTIGLIMDNTLDKAYANPFIYETFRGIEKSVYEGGYNLLLLGKNTIQNNKLAVINVIEHKLVDGLILSPEIIDSNYYKIKDYKLPLVSTGSLKNDILNISSVDIDNISAGYCATEYLYQRGYRKIGFLGIDFSKNFARDRYTGYIQFLKSKNLEPIKETEIYNKSDSIICLDNIFAYKALQRCKELNKNIPDEIGIITFDNYPLAEYLEPTVTNVEIDLYQLGVRAGEEIIRKVKNGENDSKYIKIPPFINIRSSTK
ncbi:MAG: LacI family DNA-binding transcriptional regulator [Clostridiaceae bacterium]